MLRAPSAPPTVGMGPLRRRRAVRLMTAPSLRLDYGRTRRGRRRRSLPPTNREDWCPPATRLSDPASYPVYAARRCAAAPQPTSPRMSERLRRQRGEIRASFHLHSRSVAAFARADRRTEEHLLAVRQRDLA